MAPASSSERGRVRAATPTDVSQALAERRRRERRRHAVMTGIGLLVVAVLAALVWLVGHSSVLASKRVQVVGTKLLTPAQIEQVAAVPMGVPLAQFDPDPVAARVSQLPAVSHVTVRTRYPDTVVVDVTERTTVLQRALGTRWQHIDREGVVFETVDKLDPSMPVVTSSSVETRLLSGAAEVASSLTPALRGQLAQVQAPGADQLTLVLKDKRSIVWGSSADTALKCQVAEALLAQPKFTLFNVSAPSNPTAR